MTRSATLVVSCMLALAACGDDRYVLVESQAAPLASADPARWAVEPSESEIEPLGTFRYPHPIALRFGVESVVNHDVTRIETVSANITPVETRLGTLCVVTVPPTCEGTTCDAELSVLAGGNCLIRIRAVTADGERRGGCWNHGQYELADPVNNNQIPTIIARDAEELETCQTAL